MNVVALSTRGRLKAAPQRTTSEWDTNSSSSSVSSCSRVVRVVSLVSSWYKCTALDPARQGERPPLAVADGHQRTRDWRPRGLPRPAEGIERLLAVVAIT